MNAAPLFQAVALTFVLLSAVGAPFGWAAWYVWRRWGGAAAGGLWALGAVAITALMAARVHQVQAGMGFTAEQQARFAVFPRFLPMWATALGAVLLAVRRRARGWEPGFGAGLAARSVTACWLGIVAFLVAYAALDLAGLLP